MLLHLLLKHSLGLFSQHFIPIMLVISDLVTLYLLTFLHRVALFVVLLLFVRHAVLIVLMLLLFM